MKELLVQIPIFQCLPDEDLARLEQVAMRYRYRPDYNVFFEGDPPDRLYAITKGSVKIYQEAEDGRQMVLGIRGAGQFFGEMALIDGQPRSAGVVTLCQTEVIAISQVQFRWFVSESPAVLWKVLEGLSQRLRDLADDHFELAFRSEPYRLIHALIKLSQLSVPDASKAVIVNIVWRDLAGIVGTTLERLRALLVRLENRHLIRIDGERILISQPPALRKVLALAEEL